MAQRIPVNRIVVYRNGKQMVAPIGKPFNFTAEEMADINAHSPGAVRKPVDESDPDTSVDSGDTGEANKGETSVSKPAGTPSGASAPAAKGKGAPAPKTGAAGDL